MEKEELLEGKVLLVDKPLDWTSFQAVNKLKYKIRKQYDLKKFKIGHAGTLDPRATGLLVICTGKATKKISEIQEQKKQYRATIKLGVQTESYDTEKPEILHQDISHLSNEEIEKALESFVGEISQTPPVFSAIKVDGKRAYDLARQGKEVEMKSRKTTIYGISSVDIQLPYVSFTVDCSKGTYIRSLAHDIGQSLKVGAYLSDLRRTKIGDYLVEDAIPNVLENDFQFVDYSF